MTKIKLLVGLIVGLCLLGCGPTNPQGSGGTGGTGGTGGGGLGGAHPTPGDVNLSIPGPFTVARYTSGWADSATYGAATIYYAPSAPTPWAGVAVVPGFTEMQLGGWGQFLAAHGFVTITVDTNTPLDSPEARASALVGAVQTLRSEGDRAGSPLQGKMSDSYGVMGHSMGGGGTLQAAADNLFGAAVSLMPWTVRKDFTGARTPILVISGQTDALVNPDDVYATIYPTITSQYKALTEYALESHVFANNPLANTAHAQLAAQYALAWFETFLHTDARYESVIKNNAAFSRFDAHLP